MAPSSKLQQVPLQARSMAQARLSGSLTSCTLGPQQSSCHGSSQGKGCWRLKGCSPAGTRPKRGVMEGLPESWTDCQVRNRMHCLGDHCGPSALHWSFANSMARRIVPACAHAGFVNTLDWQVCPVPASAIGQRVRDASQGCVMRWLMFTCIWTHRGMGSQLCMSALTVNAQCLGTRMQVSRLCAWPHML